MQLTADELARLRELGRAGDYEVRGLLAAYDAGDRDDELLSMMLDEL